MSRLQGKVALITGGTSGIGAATAKLFRAQGATVIATGSSAASVAAAKKTLDGIVVLHSDASDPAAIKVLVDKVVADYKKIDVLFVNAGTSRLSPIEHMDEASLDRVFAVNFKGPYLLVKQALPVIPDGGSIIFTGSAAAVQGLPGLSAYGASKAALRSLGTTLAVELAPRKIRVNTIVPGFIETPFGSKLGLTPEQIKGIVSLLSKTPLGRQGTPDEVAELALYLASPQSQFVTGAEFRIDGGLTAV